MMKKLISIVLAVFMAASTFALSYKNNTYQKLADEYAKKAQVALDAGEYEDAVEYSRLAEENAELSKAYIEMMVARKAAEDSITMAKNKIAWADGINAAEAYPMAYSAAKENLENAERAFAREDWDKAAEYAKLSLASLDGVGDKSILPEYYIVRDWEDSGDCFWNIAGRPYSYNDPWQWKELYNANKDLLEDPKNPNVIEPGITLKIPSIKGEVRSGTYDPKKEYQTFKK